MSDRALDVDGETWLVEFRGHEIVGKLANRGRSALSEIEALIYFFWVLDYSVRNAGDVALGEDLEPNLFTELRDLSRELELSETLQFVTVDFSSLSGDDLETLFYDSFDIVCDEIRALDTQLRGTSS